MIKNAGEQVDEPGRRKTTQQINPIDRNVWIVRKPGEQDILLVIIRNNTVRIILNM